MDCSYPDKLTPRQMNSIISIFHRFHLDADTSGMNEHELSFYRSLCRQAEEIYEKYGDYPVFDLCELD